MSNVVNFPKSSAPATPKPSTPEEWHKAYTALGEAILTADQAGVSSLELRRQFRQMSADLPDEVKAGMESTVTASELVELASHGWNFLKALVSLKLKLRI